MKDYGGEGFDVEDLEVVVGRGVPSGVELGEAGGEVCGVSADDYHGVAPAGERGDGGEDAVQIVGIGGDGWTVHVGSEEEDLSDGNGSSEKGGVAASCGEAGAKSGSVESARGDDYGVAEGEPLLMPTEVFEEDLAESAGGVVDVCANSSAASALAFETLDASTLRRGERAGNEASEVGGEVGERFHAAKLRRDERGKA